LLLRFFLSICLCNSLFALSLDEYFLDNYEEALVQAKKEKKKIYMLLDTQNSQECSTFIEKLEDDEDTLWRMQKEYVLLHLDVKKDSFPKRFVRIRLPRHYIFTPKEAIVYSFTEYENMEFFNAYLDEAEYRYKKMYKRIH